MPLGGRKELLICATRMNFSFALCLVKEVRLLSRMIPLRPLEKENAPGIESKSSIQGTTGDPRRSWLSTDMGTLLMITVLCLDQDSSHMTICHSSQMCIQSRTNSLHVNYIVYFFLNADNDLQSQENLTWVLPFAFNSTRIECRCMTFICCVKHFGDCNRSLRWSQVVHKDENIFCSGDFSGRLQLVVASLPARKDSTSFPGRAVLCVLDYGWAITEREMKKPAWWKITLIRMEMGEWRLWSLVGRFNTYSRTNWG